MIYIEGFVADHRTLEAKMGRKGKWKEKSD